MKATLAFCVVLMLSWLGGARNPAKDSAADESKLVALENAWNQAQLHHDAKALNQLVPDTFVYTDYDGTVMNKAQFLADLKDPAYRATLITNQDVKVYPYQNVAIVIGTYHTKGTYKRQPFEHYGRFTDTWIYENNKWQCVASHTNLIKR
jgi:ketosteroid isomerase-like protein